MTSRTKSTRKAFATVVAIANQKGGVGKTTTAATLGVAIHQLQKKVLLIDLDPQASLSISFGIPILQLERTIYHVLLRPEIALASVIQKTTSGPDLAPSNIDLSAAELELAAVISRESILKDILEPLRQSYDIIIVDCPPSLGLLTLNALVAANTVLIPLQCDYLAMKGMQLLLSTIDKVRTKLNPKLHLGGILLTMFDGRTTHSKEVADEVRSAFGNKVYPDPIKYSVRLKEAPASGFTILQYANSHDAAKAYRRLAEVIVR